MTQVQPYEPQDAAYETFLDTHPGYRNTAALDEIRARDFARLDERRQVYLDYTGAGLYAVSQLGAMLSFSGLGSLVILTRTMRHR